MKMGFTIDLSGSEKLKEITLEKGDFKFSNNNDGIYDIYFLEDSIYNNTYYEAGMTINKIEFNDNNVLTLDNGKISLIPHEELTLSNLPTTLNQGNYTVGTDINAGTYELDTRSTKSIYTGSFANESVKGSEFPIEINLNEGDVFYYDCYDSISENRNKVSISCKQDELLVLKMKE